MSVMNGMIEHSHKRLDRIERQLDKLAYNNAPTVPQYDLQSNSNFVNWTFSQISSLVGELDVNFGVADPLHDYVITVPDYSPQGNGNVSGPFGSPASSTTPTIGMELTWDSTVTGAYQYFGANQNQLTNTVCFQAILARSLIGRLMPIATGTIIVNPFFPGETTITEGDPITFDYDGLNTVICTVGSSLSPADYRIGVLKPGGTYGYGPVVSGTGAPITCSLDLSGNGFAATESVCVFLLMHDLSSGRQIMGNVDDFQSYRGVIFVYGTVFSVLGNNAKYNWAYL